MRRPAGLAAIGVVATLLLTLAVVVALLLTGDASTVSANAALIGALIALGGVFTTQLVNTALHTQRAQEDRGLEAQRAHEAALQRYFGQVGKLLLEQPLHRATPNDELSIVVRAHTLAALEGLDAARKRILLQFLYESALIDKDQPVVTLVGANLSGTNVGGAWLLGANLYGANMTGADLREANLMGTNLAKTDLSKTWPSRADLYEADLREANLRGANLLKADLSGADLRRASLSEADLSQANLRRANLMGANLMGANLTRADLSDSEVTKKQLATCCTLDGATMPDGSTHD